MKRIINRRKAKAESAVEKAIDFAEKRGDQDALTLLGGQNAQPLQAEEVQAQEGQEAQEQSRPDSDGVLMEDANGNRAIVFPDGTFREIQ